jgi:3-deoxy-manno-octulosonate cytidylyltransferase (CMP-KDO synthetase)
MQITAVIPARFASSRLPGKPLADINGKPMIQWVYERTASAGHVGDVIVATDDRRIYEKVEGFGGKVVMTRADHPSGTDRLAEVAERNDADILINVQGDEPLIDGRMIDQAVEPFLVDRTLQMGTLKSRLEAIEDFTNPSIVKVVTDLQGFALYFSRSPLPWPRNFDVQNEALLQRIPLYRHVGLYVYRRGFLLAFARMKRTPLEMAENLEQLRALENGVRIKVIETDFNSHGVDTAEDLERVRALLAYI